MRVRVSVKGVGSICLSNIIKFVGGTRDGGGGQGTVTCTVQVTECRCVCVCKGKGCVTRWEKGETW